MKAIPGQRDIIDRRALIKRVDAIVGDGERPAEAMRADLLDLLRAALKAGRGVIRQRFEIAASARETIRATSFLTDQIVRTIHDFTIEHVYPLPNPTAGERLALVATGGYGRGEMAPFSDVDLLFLLAWKPTPHTEQVVEFMLYMLWDLGFKVGHATRSVDDCLRLARQDLTIRTSILEVRLLAGEDSLFRELRRRYQDEIMKDSGPAFVGEKLAERERRHERMGDSRYVLEPNVKEGKGGLRDLHSLFWIAKYLYQVDAVPDLVARGMLTRREAARFARVENFLWAVRCHLHFLTGRAEEILTFDLQPRVGERMGYVDRGRARGVERFMKHYFLVAKEVGDLTRIFCAALEARHVRPPRRIRHRRRDGALPAGLTVDGAGRVNVERDDVFRTDPVNLLRLFHVARTGDLDIHPDALQLVTRSLGLINRSLRHDPEANRLFMEMLVSPEDPETTLRRLNEAGVLGRFLPDFGRVVAQMQHDMYHIYTVDEHTIRAIGLLDRIRRGELAEDHPLSTEILPKIQSQRALVVAVLLHDIAKGRGGNHSVLGAGVAQDLCPRLGLDEEETETVAWLVLHHLAMSNTAQKRDIDDPKTIIDFAELVQSPERLRLLLVLTVVDMRATGPKVWNGWKAALLRELYWRAEEVMSGTFEGEGVADRVRRAQDAVRQELAGWEAADIESFLARGYTGYWLTVDAATHARHARMLREADLAGQDLAVDSRVDTDRAVTEITVYTRDHPGLFSRITGAIALTGASVVDARIVTLADGMAVDSFQIQDAEGGPFDRPDRLARLATRIRQALTGDIDLDRELAGRRSLPARAAQVFRVPPRVLFDNSASRYYTIIEVNGRDRPGLLHAVGRAITDAGLQIASAKINTFGERVVDVFYVKDVFGMKLESERKRAGVRASLLAALADPDCRPAPAPVAALAEAGDNPAPVPATTGRD